MVVRFDNILVTYYIVYFLVQGLKMTTFLFISVYVYNWAIYAWLFFRHADPYDFDTLSSQSLIVLTFFWPIILLVYILSGIGRIINGSLDGIRDFVIGLHVKIYKDFKKEEKNEN